MLVRRYQTTLSLHQSFLSIRSITKEGPNEVHITYDLPADEMEGTTLVLVIQPSANGRQKGTLLDATVRLCATEPCTSNCNNCKADQAPRPFPTSASQLGHRHQPSRRERHPGQRRAAACRRRPAPPALISVARFAFSPFPCTTAGARFTPPAPSTLLLYLSPPCPHVTAPMTIITPLSNPLVLFGLSRWQLLACHRVLVEKQASRMRARPAVRVESPSRRAKAERPSVDWLRATRGSRRGRRAGETGRIPCRLL